jgi:hypothetical protein
VSRSKNIKLANALYANNELPRAVEGVYQTPDFLWAIYHEDIDENSSILQKGQLDRGVWCECVGEGKPAQDRKSFQHALCQAIIAGAASLYHQLSIDVDCPTTLLFTLNGPVVKFFVLRASCTPPSNLRKGKHHAVGTLDRTLRVVTHPWHLECQPLDIQWDLQDLQHCFRMHAFSVLLEETTAKRLEFFDNKWVERNKTNRAPHIWWLLPKKSKSTASPTDTPSVAPHSIPSGDISDLNFSTLSLSQQSSRHDDAGEEGQLASQDLGDMELYSMSPQLGVGAAEEWEMHSISSANEPDRNLQRQTSRITGFRKIKLGLSGFLDSCFGGCQGEQMTDD